MRDPKRIILSRRAQFVAAALAGCSPGVKPVVNVEPAPFDAAIPSAVASVEDPPPVFDAGTPLEIDSGRRVVVSVCLSIYVPPKITFPTNSDVPDATAMPTIAEAAKILSAQPNIMLDVQGHTDPSEPIAVGQKRADAIKAELVKRGVLNTRITTSNAGSTMPLAPNNTIEGRAKNRRVELIVK